MFLYVLYSLVWLAFLWSAVGLEESWWWGQVLSPIFIRLKLHILLNIYILHRLEVIPYLVQKTPRIIFSLLSGTGNAKEFKLIWILVGPSILFAIDIQALEQSMLLLILHNLINIHIGIEPFPLLLFAPSLVIFEWMYLFRFLHFQFHILLAITQPEPGVLILITINWIYKHFLWILRKRLHEFSSVSFLDMGTWWTFCEAHGANEDVIFFSIHGYWFAEFFVVLPCCNVIVITFLYVDDAAARVGNGLHGQVEHTGLAWVEVIEEDGAVVTDSVSGKSFFFLLVIRAIYSEHFGWSLLLIHVLCNRFQLCLRVQCFRWHIGLRQAVEAALVVCYIYLFLVTFDYYIRIKLWHRIWL